ncbi:hypothetical protein SSS_05814 [Sarcoptes scabiei]|nr:hypothetical protein SSS_05814 [Sarcoptes scabiei]
MILNMKTYKGFDKLPYCNAHCPQARATTVAETPESRRLAENTKLQSNIKYHEDFEKQKGKLTQIADDAETLRIRNTSKIISNATYHGEYEKKKQMEERRTLIGGEENAYPSNEIHMNSIAGSQHQSSAYPPCQSDRTMTQTKLSQSITTNNSDERIMSMNSNRENYHIDNSKKLSHSGFVKDQRLISGNPLSQTSLNVDMSHSSYHSITNPSSTQSMFQRPQQQGPIYDPNSINQQIRQISASSQHHHQMRPNLGLCFRAIYDYNAQDVDEVTFVDGDLIIHCEPIDDGWMTGTVERTGQTGMLPSNYVEPV